MKKKIITKENSFNFFEVLLIVIVTAIVFSFCTGIIYLNKFNNSITINKELTEFVKAYNTIVENYYEDVDKKDLIDSAISGMYNFLNDPYTTYLDEESATSLIESLQGKYKGIGIQIKEQDEDTVILKVLEDTPASEAGLKAGDIILAINDKDVTNLSLTEITSIIKKGETNTFKIKIRRFDEEYIYNIERKELEIPVVSYSELTNNNKKVGYINISVFGESATSQVKKALDNLNKKGVNDLIIDLRDNNGGYLNVAKSISELFLKEGSVIYSLEVKSKKTYYYDESNESQNGRIIVLINGGTASASEILAAALKYSYGATLLGVKTYGKGKVQQTAELEDGRMVKYTSSKWFMANDECIDEVGINPDITIKADTITINDDAGTPVVVYSDVDNQLNEALKEMTK